MDNKDFCFGKFTPRLSKLKMMAVLGCSCDENRRDFNHTPSLRASLFRVKLSPGFDLHDDKTYVVHFVFSFWTLFNEKHQTEAPVDIILSQLKFALLASQELCSF